MEFLQVCEGRVKHTVRVESVNDEYVQGSTTQQHTVNLSVA